MTEQQLITAVLVVGGAVLGRHLMVKLFARRRPAPADSIGTRHRTNRVNWRDRRLEVKARVVPRYFWSTVSINVHLDGTALIRTGGVFRGKGLNEAQFDEWGETHSLGLSWTSPTRGFYFPYRLLVDDGVVLESTVKPPNWPMVFMPVLPLALMFLASVWIVYR